MNKKQKEQQMENMKKHVKEHTSFSRAGIHDRAELSAELYVSSVLGLSDDDEEKDIIKKQYKDTFLEEVKNFL